MYLHQQWWTTLRLKLLRTATFGLAPAIGRRTVQFKLPPNSVQALEAKMQSWFTCDIVQHGTPLIHSTSLEIV